MAGAYSLLSFLWESSRRWTNGAAVLRQRRMEEAWRGGCGGAAATRRALARSGWGIEDVNEAADRSPG